MDSSGSDYELPTIACIRGYALGTGLLMALACDMRVAEENTTLESLSLD